MLSARVDTKNVATLLTAYVISGPVIIDRYRRLLILPIETGIDQHAHNLALSQRVLS